MAFQNDKGLSLQHQLKQEKLLKICMGELFVSGPEDIESSLKSLSILPIIFQWKQKLPYQNYLRETMFTSRWDDTEFLVSKVDARDFHNPGETVELISDRTNLTSSTKKLEEYSRINYRN